MKRKIKFLFVTSSLALGSFAALSIEAKGMMDDSVDVLLEQQQSNTSDKIRYISTINLSNDVTLDDIETINMQLELTKDGMHQKATHELKGVYDCVSGKNGKVMKDNTYYAVFTITDLVSAFPGWTISTNFEYNYKDNSKETTNTVTYQIPEIHQLNNGNGTFDETYECFANSIQDGQILQCFCWSYKEIMNYLPTIASQGFTAIQTSPVQVCKEATVGKNAKGSWWAYYQPAAFTIDDTGDNALGNKEDFIKMCEMAHDLGVKVVVDVVANHLGNQWVADSLCERAYYYEWEIAGMNAPADINAKKGEDGYIPYTGKYWGFDNAGPVDKSDPKASTVPVIDSYYYEDTIKTHPYMIQNNDDPENVTQGNIGMMDLDTKDPVVQDRVASYLEELISYGVDGFRFDAAKHIETPYDKISSDFWPTVITRAKNAGKKLGKDIYAYGEILNRPGEGRSLKWYTDSGVAITDSGLGHNIVENGGSGHGDFNGADGNNYSEYTKDMVTWAESHDNYMGTQDTHGKSDEIINKAYAILASRKDFSTLYCARFEDYENSILGSVACLNGWSYASVGAVNKFHNFYSKTQAEEDLRSDSGYTITERYNDNKSTNNGIVLVGNEGNVNISVNHMADGKYIDYVTGNEFTVSNGVLSGYVGKEGIAVVYNNTSTTIGHTSITSLGDNTFYTNSQTISYIINNADSAKLIIDNKTYDITSGASITFGYDMKVNDSKIITIEATLNGKTTTKEFTYTKVEAPKTYTIHFDKPNDWENLYAYFYKENETTPLEVSMDIDYKSNTYYAEYMIFYKYVSFGNGKVQTERISLSSEDLTYELDENSTYAYFKTSSSSSVNAYLWNKTTGKENDKWPGKEIKKDEETDLHIIDYTGYEYVIFNYGSVKTKDIKINTEYPIVYEYNSNYFEGIKVKLHDTCNHDYKVKNWVWESNTNVSLILECLSCNKEKTINAKVTSTITVEPTETSYGIREYLASVSYNGIIYTDTKEVTLPMLDNSIIEVKSVEPTCDEDGNILYYIKDNHYYLEKTCETEITLEDTIINKLGHSFETLIVSKDTKSVTCNRCDEEIIVTVDNNTIYYVNTNNYDTVYAYLWYESGKTAVNNHAWPGEKMTKTGLTYNGYDIYSIDITNTNFINIIFSNGNGSQTKDLVIPSDSNCYIDGSFDYIFLK